MRLIPSDPDVYTLLSRIRNGDLDLQPDFQRGEVWSYAKKQKLIDSVLRQWHVPPIHVIETKESALQEVLDGQQRLVSIRDFADDKVKINGQIEPLHEEICRLDGLTYSQLPEAYRRRFDQFTIRVFRIIDYTSGEPGELFFRLNQPVGLTTAEQRNAFFGHTRHQVRELVHAMENAGINKDLIGFSNSRMAYDDIIARVAMTLDDGTLAKKIDASRLTNQYRSETPFAASTLQRISKALNVLSGIKGNSRTAGIKFNKATLYSWLLFIVRAQEALERFDSEVLANFLSNFELARLGVLAMKSDTPLPVKALVEAISIYEDRSTSRVGDVSSVVLRDVVLWVMYIALDFSPKPHVQRSSPVFQLHQAIQITPYSPNPNLSGTDHWLDALAKSSEWGAI